MVSDEMLDAFQQAHDAHFDAAMEILRRQEAGEDISPGDYSIAGILQNRVDGMLVELQRLEQIVLPIDVIAEQ